MSDLEPQPIPQKAQCPECGGAPDEGKVEHRLSALGYKHDDQRHHCVDCGNQWTAGVPIGEFDKPELADDLYCGSCGTLMLVHWIDTGTTWSVRGGDLTLGLKCPDEECRTFDTVGRDADDEGRILVGYDVTAGQTAGAEAYGYPEEVTDAHDE